MSETQRTIAIDIDGTIRNLTGQIEKHLEIDHPELIDRYRELSKSEYWALSKSFNGDKSALYSWMYDQRVFELFGMAGRMHPKVVDELNAFAKVAEKDGKFKVVIASVQRDRSVTATLHWLAKWGCRIQTYYFFKSMQEKIDAGFDFYVDDCPTVIEQIIAQDKNRIIKVPYAFNRDMDCRSLDIENGKFNDIYEFFDLKKEIL